MTNYTVPQNVAISDSGFLFQSATGESFTLNEIGRLVFKMLQSNFTGAQIIEKICDEYDAEAKSVERDLEDFTAQLQHYSLLKLL